MTRGFRLFSNTKGLPTFSFTFPRPPGDEKPYCGRTTIGWYINSQGLRACWKGKKMLSTMDNPEDLISEPTEQRYVVEPEDLQRRSDALLQTRTKAKSHLSKQRIQKMYAKIETEEKLEKNKQIEFLKYHKNSKNHRDIVDSLNLIQKKRWTAKVYPQFESKTIEELNRMAGRKASLKPKPLSLPQKGATVDVYDLPIEWSWEDELGKVREQQGCGSCYLMATVQMLEARLRIKYKHNVTLSVQDALDCNYYNQGCNGGIPYLTELFGQEHPFVPEDCSPYKALPTKCGTCDISKLEIVYKVADFRFVGGAYGLCDERKMMIELMTNGPLVASFEPTNEFMYYESGIFESVAPEWVVSNGEKPQWEKVDHSVLLYGWGETEDGIKYWKLRNSWGELWGENGNFRMRRGVDESAIESIAEASDPVIVYRY